MPKTAIIFNEIEDITYFIIDGDLTIYNGTYIGGGDSKLELKLAREIYEKETGEYKHQPKSLAEVRQAIIDGAFLIECGSHT